MSISKQFINLLVFLISWVASSSSVKSQIVPDGSLETRVDRLENVSEISGGTTRGDNLFHSFKELSIGVNNEAFFNNANNIQNIFSRVTGNTISNINGLIRANGDANLFLINPAGIIFGENAQIDIGGSLAVTTADELKFPDANFRTDDSEGVELSINFPIGLGFGSNSGSVTVNGEKNNIFIEIPSFRVASESFQSLRVKPEKSISIIADTIKFNGAGLEAEGGNIELVSIKEVDEIKLIQSSDWFKSDLKSLKTVSNTFADIRLENAASLNVSGETAGNIDIYGQNVYLDDGASIIANTSLPTKNSININSNNLVLRGSARNDRVNFISLDEINNIVIESRKEIDPVSIDGKGNYYSVSFIGADVLGSGTFGQGNTINLNAKNIRVLEGSQIRAINLSSEQTGIKAGDINLNVQKNITVQGGNQFNNSIPSFIDASNGISKFGDTGDINIEAETIDLQDGGAIKVDSFGTGEIGKLDVQAKEINISGTSMSNFSPNTPIFNVPGLISSSLTEGNSTNISGTIDINVESLNIFQGGTISSNSLGRNSAGNINIKANEITLTGFPDGTSARTTISARVFQNSNNNTIPLVDKTNSVGGNIVLDTKKLQVLNGATLEVGSNSGDSGNLRITAENIILDGTRLTTEGEFTGGISADAGFNSFGKGGNIEINTDSLKILDGSIVRAISLGSGDAGNIRVDAEEIEISGTDRFAPDPTAPEAVSKINTGALNANGGDLSINANSIKLDNLARIQATTIEGSKGGNINLSTNSINLQGQSQITASTQGQGNGGNIAIASEVLSALENSDITANAIGGNGGNIVIDSDFIFGSQGQPELTPFSDITASSELGIDGQVNIDTLDTNIEDQLVISAKETNLVQTEFDESTCINKYGEKAQFIDLGDPKPESPYYPLYDSNDELVDTNLASTTEVNSQELVEANQVKTLPNGDQYLIAAPVTQIQSNGLCVSN